MDVPASSSAIKSLIEASSGAIEHCWEIGWSLAAHTDRSQKFKGSMLVQVGFKTTSILLPLSLSEMIVTWSILTF